MKTRLRKFGPPVAVIGAALYLGWPPSAPMDLGDDIVRAKSVRWKVTELDPPNLTIHTAPDPFAAVLVDATSNQPVMPQGKPQQVRNESWGPTENDLRKGLSLSGIARTDSYRWAVVNRRVCRPGDTVPVIGLVDVEATIEQIHHDKITVAVDALIVDIRPDQHKSSSATTPPASDIRSDKEQSLPSTEDEDEDEDEDEQANRQWNGKDPKAIAFQKTT